MKKSLLLSLLLVVLLAVSLPRTTVATVRATFMETAWMSSQSQVECVGVGVYKANSTYEANRRRLAGLLLAESAARGPSYRERAVGYWPNRLQASFFCRRRVVDGTGSGDPYCAACIAGAFLEVDRQCPYHREASFLSRNCTLELGEYRILGTGGILDEGINKHALGLGLIFQGIGFGWLFFLLLQEWRSRKRGTMMNSTSLSSGD